MQLFTLGNSFHYPTNYIEEYSSLIWTERYRANGDFELKTPNVKDTIALLPLGSHICILESNEIMIVETHDIQIDALGESVLTVTGRSLETFFENRITMINEDPIIDGGGDVAAITMVNRTSATAARYILVDAVSNLLDTNEVIPLLSVVEISLPSGLALSDHHIPRASVYPEMIKLLEQDNLGIKNRRPTASDGNIQMQVYGGTDKRSTVILDVEAGHFAGAVHILRSIKGYKTAVHVASKNYYRKVYTSLGAQTSWSHRVDLLDQADVTKTGATIPGMLDNRGRAYLTQNGKTNIFDGAVSATIPYVYGTDYNLGDRILVKNNDYSFIDDMYVVEYIRVENESGEVGYPTLSETN